MALDVSLVSRGCGWTCAWRGDPVVPVRTGGLVPTPALRRLLPAELGSWRACSPAHALCCHSGPEPRVPSSRFSDGACPHCAPFQADRPNMGRRPPYVCCSSSASPAPGLEERPGIEVLWLVMTISVESFGPSSSFCRY